MYALLTLTRDHAQLKHRSVGSIMQPPEAVFSLLMGDVVGILTIFCQRKNVKKFVNQVGNIILYTQTNYIYIYRASKNR